jgi:hypothetical protein
MFGGRLFIWFDGFNRLDAKSKSVIYVGKFNCWYAQPIELFNLKRQQETIENNQIYFS